jgi:2-iminobutanoate/2-iminopropanoate deaminase
MKKIIQTEMAPAPIGPYNQAVLSDKMLFVSGQIAIDPATGEMVQEDISAETKQVMLNLENILKEAGMGFENVVKTTIFLNSMEDFNEVNKVYGTFFKNNYPARETVEVRGLPKNANVEISFIAVKD